MNKSTEEQNNRKSDPNGFAPQNVCNNKQTTDRMTKDTNKWVHVVSESKFEAKKHLTNTKSVQRTVLTRSEVISDYKIITETDSLLIKGFVNLCSKGKIILIY